VQDYLVVRDLGSTNGIRINGVRVVEGRIKPGDELTIGSHRYQVRLEADAAGGMPPPAEIQRKKTGRLAPPPADDDALESCEEPIAIPEPQGPAVSLPAAQAIPAVPPPPVPEAPASELAPVVQSPPPLRLPDHLELAPSSNAFPPAPSSSSHHPS
jgi:hypothetical protein